MPRKPKLSGGYAVRSSEALASLETWLAGIDPGARQRGEDYRAQGRVISVVADADHFVEAKVEGQELYLVTLFLTRGKWTSACTCPMRRDCKHAAAAALTWISANGADLPPADDIIFPEVTGAASARKKSSTRKIPFSEQWAPQIAAKLGRPLAVAEIRQLGQLAALHTEFTQAHGHLYEDHLQRHGFADAIPPNTQRWTPLFHDWWPPGFLPSDPWDLWQYLAYSLENRGLPIPEVFRPFTDTSRIHAALDANLARQQLDTWRHALATPGTPDLANNPLLAEASSLRARLDSEGQLFLEARSAPDKPWKPPSQKWSSLLARARAADFEAFPPAEAALALSFAMANRHGYHGSFKRPLQPEHADAILASRAAHSAIVLPGERPFAIEPAPLVPEAIPDSHARLAVRLVTPDGIPATGARLIARQPVPLYLHDGRVWRGPPPLPEIPLPTSVLGDTQLMTALRARGIRLPATLEAKVRRVALRPRLKCWLADSEFSYTWFHAQLLAVSDDPPCAQYWRGSGGWAWAKDGPPPARRPDDPLLEFDLSAANAVGARFSDFRLSWNDWQGSWTRTATKNFPAEFLAWHATLPPGLDIETDSEIAAFFDPPLRAHVDFSAIPADSGHDWFDLTVALRVEDTTLTPDEIALLLKARGQWIRLPRGDWRRLELADAEASTPAAATLDRLGLSAEDVLASGHATTHRLHALQLASEASTLEARDAHLASELRRRVAALAALPPPPTPPGLTATLRPYQLEGFHFLAHLSAQGFGGVLADDMGLGKTVQTLAWLLHQSAAAPKNFRALVVCPKSVTHGWLAETQRFAPSLTAQLFTPPLNSQLSTPAQLVVANYTQLRLHAAHFRSTSWDAVILDEAQFIKNPTSQIAAAARSLPARHRLVLTGTPVENRLTDLWSLFAFAQPGLLGPQAAFRRQYDEKDPAALARLHRRVRHFLLRRTKAQAAPDLPPRTEDELVVELEPAQRKLYDAELKRARAQLLGVETSRALDKVRFNILASLLRLRQICCHPALIDPAHAALPSAKLDALLERIEELRDEGHQVLVFSQFVEMLEIIRRKLAAADIGHLMLTGATENRAALVDQFQTDPSKTVFLLSLKAAGFGLNLTAASYAILYDPWWNPAVEAQAIDRTHRIGQTRPVFAYRLLAENTVEQKIRALQREKAALAASVVQEESLANVLDLESLRRILA